MSARAQVLRPHPGAQGFTIIELMAVIVILLLVIGIAVPNLSLRAGAAARDQAIGLGSALELARQRSVATRRAHRVMFDLDRQTWWIEWQAPPSVEPATAPARWSDVDPIPLHAPIPEAQGFVPITGSHGRPQAFRGEVLLLSVESGGILAEDGLAAVPFERDGTSAPALVRLADGTGRQLILEVAPLLDSVRISHATQ